MRLLAIDYGDKRLGLALSDELGLTVRPLATIERAPKERSFQRISTLIEEHGVEVVVVGIPLRLDGSAGDAVAHVGRFMDELRTRIACPVVGWDEKLTSFEAEDRMRAAGLKPAARKAQIDQYAAMVLLEDYINSR